MGKGFSFIGNQYRLVLEDKEYFVDMLFFQPLYPVPDSAGIKNRFIPTRICGENELLPEPVGQTGKDAGRKPVHRYYIVCGQEQCGSGSGLARFNGSYWSFRIQLPDSTKTD